MERYFKIASGVLVALVVLLWSISGKYVDWLWFKSVGETSVFWVTLLTGPLTKILVGVLIFAFLVLNFWLALRAFNRTQVQVVDETNLWPEIPKSAVILPGLGIAAVLSFVLASGLSLDWTVIQQFLNQTRVGVADPVFHKDLGYYLFAFPFFQRLNNLVISVVFLGLAGTALVYLIARAAWKEGRGWELWFPAKVHLTVLTILFLLGKIWGYALGKFNLLYQESAQMTGINYTAYHAKLFGFQVLTVFLAVLIAVLIFSLFRKGTKILVGGLAAWLALSFILFGLYPGFLQSFKVAPNEFVLEAPFLKNHIDFTRKAYGLDRIATRTYIPVDTRTSARQLNQNDPALADLRLWDYRPLKSSYNQLQRIRPYYIFNDIDIDRYQSVTGGQDQMMISARELNTSALAGQAQNWINMHMTYTHGYGVAANQVNEFTAQGQPIFKAYDLPTKVDPNFPGLKVDQPRIYFGESTNDYVIVNTRNAEFDYPKGEGNASFSYDGKKGIPLKSLFNKLLMTSVFGNTNFLLSDLLTDQSSILLYRNINTRVKKLAPFLMFDNDPYLVVSGGKLYWIIDAYTASAYYPYAKAHEEGLNYLRNSVKAVINAYDGSVGFYVIDDRDPLIKVWQKVFPRLFKPVASLDPDLVRHFRYPTYLMTIQRDMLTQYHMTDPKTFYEKEDYWEIPVHNQDEPFEPYYVTVNLPDVKENGEFVIMQPFSPRGSRNLVSWLIARCDQPNYGQLIQYVLPKDQNIYGPAQIDSRINQDQTISQLVTLWNQQQSRVTWGNLLMIPVEGSILYVKPLFMESERSQQAELKKVVMVYQNQVVMGDTLADAISRLTLGTPPPSSTVPSGAPTTPPSAQNPSAPTNRKAEILKRLNDLVNEQQRLLQELSRMSQ
jgi:uncharacterized membrane protein (UPF0182 family)